MTWPRVWKALIEAARRPRQGRAPLIAAPLTPSSISCPRTYKTGSNSAPRAIIGRAPSSDRVRSMNSIGQIEKAKERVR